MTEQKIKSWVLVSFFIFGFWSSDWATLERKFFTKLGVSVLDSLVMIFHELIFVFGVRLLIFFKRNQRNFYNFIKMNFRDLNTDSESDLSEISMVELVIGWVVRFCEFRRIPRRGPHGRFLS